jgi:hypothetical protein
MRTSPARTEPDPASTARTAPGFWSKLAQAFDDYLAERTKRTVPEVTLRRSQREIDRCRRLMHKPAGAPAAIRINRAPRRPA